MEVPPPARTAEDPSRGNRSQDAVPGAVPLFAATTRRHSLSSRASGQGTRAANRISILARVGGGELRSPDGSPAQPVDSMSMSRSKRRGSAEVRSEPFGVPDHGRVGMTEPRASRAMRSVPECHGPTRHPFVSGVTIPVARFHEVNTEDCVIRLRGRNGGPVRWRPDASSKEGESNAFLLGARLFTRVEAAPELGLRAAIPSWMSLSGCRPRPRRAPCGRSRSARARTARRAGARDRSRSPAPPRRRRSARP